MECCHKWTPHEWVIAIRIAEQGDPMFVSGEIKVYSPIVQFDSAIPPSGRLRNVLSPAMKHEL